MKLHIKHPKTTLIGTLIVTIVAAWIMGYVTGGYELPETAVVGLVGTLVGVGFFASADGRNA